MGTVLHFLFLFIISGFRSFRFFCDVSKVGTGRTFFPENSGEILAYSFHAITTFHFEHCRFSISISNNNIFISGDTTFRFGIFFFLGPIKSDAGV